MLGRQTVDGENHTTYHPANLRVKPSTFMRSPMRKQVQFDLEGRGSSTKTALAALALGRLPQVCEKSRAHRARRFYLKEEAHESSQDKDFS